MFDYELLHKTHQATRECYRSYSHRPLPVFAAYEQNARNVYLDDIVYEALGGVLHNLHTRQSRIRWRNNHG
jgi:hypothetical protein